MLRLVLTIGVVVDSLVLLDVSTHSLTAAHLMQSPQPAILQKTGILGALHTVGLASFQALRDTYENDSIIVGHEFRDGRFKRLPNGSLSDANPSAGLSKTTVGAYVDGLRHESSNGRISELGGANFFLEHPIASEQLGNACSNVLPDGFKRQPGNAEVDVQHVLWASGKRYTYMLHVDYVVANLLTHVEGSKRVWLFPPEQQDSLYLAKAPSWTEHDSWESYSLVPPAVLNGSMMAAGTPFERFSKATPLRVDLKPGSTLLIPCGWAHLVEYNGPALSVSCQVLPDWLTEPSFFEEHPEWQPKGCADFIPDAVDGQTFDIEKMDTACRANPAHEHCHLLLPWREQLFGREAEVKVEL